MSEIRTPPSLKWLINRRARIAGDIEKLQKSYSKNKAATEKACEDAKKHLQLMNTKLLILEQGFNRHLKALQADLNVIDSAMTQHEIQIPSELISPIKSHEAHRLLPYGQLTRSIYECLKYADGKSRSTTEIALYTLSFINRDISDGEFVELRTSVRYRLKTLRSRGKIIKTNNTRGGAVEARWKLPDYDSFPNF